MMPMATRLFVALVIALAAASLLPYPQPVRAATDYYVNDGSTAGDIYCTAGGDDANNGTSSTTPKRTIQAIIDTYDLEPGDTVYVDTGTCPGARTAGSGHELAVYRNSSGSRCAAGWLPDLPARY